jgi:hypothetical protein
VSPSAGFTARAGSTGAVVSGLGNGRGAGASVMTSKSYAETWLDRFRETGDRDMRDLRDGSRSVSGGFSGIGL